MKNIYVTQGVPLHRISTRVAPPTFNQLVFGDAAFFQTGRAYQDLAAVGKKLVDKFLFKSNNSSPQPVSPPSYMTSYVSRSVNEILHACFGPTD